MDEILNFTKIFAFGTGMFISELMGGFDMFLKALLILIVLDYITGVAKAIYLKQISSEIGYKGILKKAMMLIVVMVACQADLVFHTESALRTGTIFFWIANEGFSILENVGQMGLPLPKQLKDILIKIKDEQESKE